MADCPLQNWPKVALQTCLPLLPHLAQHASATRSINPDELNNSTQNSLHIRTRKKTDLPQLLPARRRERAVKLRRIATQQWPKPSRARCPLYAPRPAPARGIVRWVHVSPNEIVTIVQPAQQLIRDYPTQWRVQPRGAGSTFRVGASDHTRVETGHAPGTVLRRICGHATHVSAIGFRLFDVNVIAARHVKAQFLLPRQMGHEILKPRSGIDLGGRHRGAASQARRILYDELIPFGRQGRRCPKSLPIVADPHVATAAIPVSPKLSRHFRGHARCDACPPGGRGIRANELLSPSRAQIRFKKRGKYDQREELGSGATLDREHVARVTLSV